MSWFRRGSKENKETTPPKDRLRRLSSAIDNIRKKKTMSKQDQPFVIENGIEKSKSDERSYKSITLANDLQVLLVNDARTDKAAAAMDVNVGHFSDPEDIPGLAHFLEHMLFLGTEKYPDENSYSAYLNENGGRSNAYTSMENTNYFFDVTHPHLEEALDRFAQFFISPLFTASATDRELNAVDSEHSKNVQDDGWRAFQLEKSTSSSTHPYHKFATGNSDTLKTIPEKNGVDVREALVKFHDKYYSANRMKLVIFGREPLNILEKWAKDKFSAIKTNGIGKPTYTGFPFGKEQLGRKISVVPVKDLRSIEVTWPMESMQSYYKEAPGRYVANLIGHEGPGSILSLLKEKGWANELGASLAFNNSDFALFKVSVDATDNGMERVDEIVGAIFEYVNMIRTHGPQEWLWRELATQSNCEFRFKSDSNPFAFVSRAAGNMQMYPPEHILSGGYLARSFDAESINKIVNKLTPENAQIGVAHKSCSTIADKEEYWYKTKYAVEKLDDSLLKKWSLDNFKIDACSMHLPSENEFLPSDFTIFDFEKPTPVKSKHVPVPTTATTPEGKTESVLKIWESKTGEANADAHRPPVLIKETDRSLVWFKQDTAFKRPKAILIVSIGTPVAYSSVKNSLMAELYTLLVQDALNEFAYAAQIAGLSYSLSNSLTGLSLQLGGFNHKISKLATKVIETMLNPTFSKEHFQRFKETMHKQLINWDKDQPYSHAISNASYTMNVPRWHSFEKLGVVDSITFEDLVTFIPQLFDEIALEMLVHGNATPKMGLELANIIEAEFKGKPTSFDTNELRVLKLVPKSTAICVFRGPDGENPNSAVETNFQVGMETRRLEALVGLLAHIAQEPCFNILRTEEQLGYIVFCGVRKDVGVLSLRIIVQSNKADPITLDSRIEAFLVRFEKVLEDMTEETFQSNVNAVVAKALQKDKTLFEESRRWYNEIKPRVYEFSRNFQVAGEVKNATKNDLIKFFNEFIKKGAPQRKKFVAAAVSGVHCETTFGAANTESRPVNPRNLDANVTKELKALIGEDTEFIENIADFKEKATLYPPRSHVAKL